MGTIVVLLALLVDSSTLVNYQALCLVLVAASVVALVELAFVALEVEL